MSKQDKIICLLKVWMESLWKSVKSQVESLWSLEWKVCDEKLRNLKTGVCLKYKNAYINMTYQSMTMKSIGLEVQLVSFILYLFVLLSKSFVYLFDRQDYLYQSLYFKK